MYSVHEVKRHVCVCVCVCVCGGGFHVLQKLAKSCKILSCKINFEVGKSDNQLKGEVIIRNTASIFKVKALLIIGISSNFPVCRISQWSQNDSL